MKPFRVTLKYSLNGDTTLLSTTVPAYSNAMAIDKVIDAYNLAGLVTASKAEKVN